MNIQAAHKRSVTVPNPVRQRRSNPRTAAEFHTLSLQIGDAAARPASRRQRPQEKALKLPRWKEVLNLLLPLQTAHQQREAEEKQREEALLKVADDLRQLRFHLDTVNDLYVQLGTSPIVGLERAGVQRRKGTYGRNVLSPPPRQWAQRVWRWFFTGFNRFLWVAMVVFWLCWKPIGNPPQSGNMAMAVVIILVIFLQAMFSAWQEWITSRAMHSITSMLPTEATVLRDGRRRKLAPEELVPGDIVYLQTGDRVPADIRLVEVSLDLLLDRSELSGTPDPTIGTLGYTSTNYLETRNMAMMGANVTQGQCVGVVVATGDRTVLGRIGRLVTSKQTERTLLQIEVQRLVNWLTSVSLAVGTLFIVLWAVWLRTEFPGFMSVSDALANGVGVLVTFVPGGLPISLTLAMTAIAKRMQRYRLLVKNLTTVETLGTVDVICCEKTGTLTQRLMAAVRIGMGDEELAATKLVADCEAPTVDGLQPAVRRIYEVLALCNSAVFDPLLAHIPADERVAMGDATDCALLRLAEQLCPLRQAEKRYKTLVTVPFSLRRRWMLTVCAEYQKEPFMLVKGAPEALLPHCGWIQMRSGAVEPLTDELRERLEEMQRRWAETNGSRVLLLCRREFSNDEHNPLRAHADSPAALYIASRDALEGLCVVGLVALADPPREEIADTIVRFRGAGIRVFMVTGDYAPTATFVARQCGMISDTTAVEGIAEVRLHAKEPAMHSAKAEKGHYKGRAGCQTESLLEACSESTLAGRAALVVSGDELLDLQTEEWDAIAAYETCVFARITPEQKLQVVEELRTRGCTVAVTGDEVNDVPAMRAAHVGVAMGNGSAVAREAAEMVLLDSSLASLAVGIESGRLMFINLKKVIIYLLPMTNLSEIIPSFFNVVLGLPIPLSTFLMLVINTITDVWASVVLTYEEPETDLMLHPPRNSVKEGLVNTRFFVQAYGFIGIIETLTGHFAFFLCLYLRGGIAPRHVFLAFNKWTDGYLGKTKDELALLVNMAGSAHFMALVIMQWANMFVARTRFVSVFRQNPLWGPRRNPLLLVSIPISVAVALFFNEIDWFNNVFLTGKIPVEFFFLPIPFALLLLTLEELRKLLVRRYPNGILARIAW
ncbi:hypothetical protein IWW36_001063 [Coemansia brasiliensis]|uniref:Cation-transporting P-type ATPase N-terminal domain-containing protein n=1 Tax=Coemansia brasiliensis TaxID=2650707 RepID=A0A9W8M2F0_9FUNG|nr:hypothetical protein IWW36_001063 [Coemansia brasiliensis]